MVEEEEVAAAAAAGARLQLRQQAVAVAARDAVVVDRRRLATAAAGHPNRLGCDHGGATGLARATARAVANGSAEVAMGVGPAISVAATVVGRRSAGATEQAGEMPDHAFATAVASVARGSAIGRDGASVMVVGVTIVVMCASTGVTIRGDREFRSGSTTGTTMAIAVG